MGAPPRRMHSNVTMLSIFNAAWVLRGAPRTQLEQQERTLLDQGVLKIE